MTHSNILNNFQWKGFDGMKNPAEVVGMLLGILTFLGGIAAALVRWFSRVEKLETQIREIQTDFAHQSGKVEAMESNIGQINSRLSAVDAKLDILINKRI